MEQKKGKGNGTLENELEGYCKIEWIITISIIWGKVELSFQYRQVNLEKKPLYCIYLFIYNSFKLGFYVWWEAVPPHSSGANLYRHVKSKFETKIYFSFTAWPVERYQVDFTIWIILFLFSENLSVGLLHTLHPLVFIMRFYLYLFIFIYFIFCE